MVVYPDGTATLLEGARAVPLGVRHELSRPAARFTVPPGATLLLYTDGLVERRRMSVDSGIASATELLVGERERGLDELADLVMSSMAPDGGYQDDVAILLYRRHQPLDLTFSAVRTQLAPARNALRRWLVTAGVSPRLAGDALLAVGEAMANGVEHGHLDHIEGTITMRAAVQEDTLHLSVSDTGRWKIPVPDDRRGRGVPLMRALMDDVVVESSSTGTTVRMSVSLK